MKKIDTVSIEQMKGALAKIVGSGLPVKITLMNGEVLVRHVRGFADPQENIIFMSETSYSLAMRVLEIKDIAVLEYAEGAGEWKALRARWANKNIKPLVL
jgi:hypothetical protein